VIGVSAIVSAIVSAMRRRVQRFRLQPKTMRFRLWYRLRARWLYWRYRRVLNLGVSAVKAAYADDWARAHAHVAAALRQRPDRFQAGPVWVLASMWVGLMVDRLRPPSGGLARVRFVDPVTAAELAIDALPVEISMRCRWRCGGRPGCIWPPPRRTWRPSTRWWPRCPTTRTSWPSICTGC
jgi:hypothetical protein